MASAATPENRRTSTMKLLATAKRFQGLAFNCHRSLATTQSQSSASVKQGTNSKLFNPTEEHQSLREMLRSFVETEVDPQALEYNRAEKFNVDLFRKLGGLGLLGITVDPQYGGSGMDATAAVIAHGKSSA